MTTAQLIESEHGQTVRLPEEYRFAGHEVRIRREGNQFIPEPLGDGWAWLGEPTPFDDDLIAAAEALQQEQRGHPQERHFRDIATCWTSITPLPLINAIPD